MPLRSSRTSKSPTSPVGINVVSVDIGNVRAHQRVVDIVVVVIIVQLDFDSSETTFASIDQGVVVRVGEDVATHTLRRADLRSWPSPFGLGRSPARRCRQPAREESRPASSVDSSIRIVTFVVAMALTAIRYSPVAFVVLLGSVTWRIPSRFWSK